MREIRTNVDIHEENRRRFGLPERRTAKIFVFRLAYGGQAYSYAHDSDFNHISKDEKYWKNVIDEFYDKYRGIAKWHDSLVRTVLDTGQLVMPTGRVYDFDRSEVARRTFLWRPKILNYPVQGCGADLVSVGRVTMWKRLRKANLPVLFQSTVHDSVDLDVPPPVGLDISPEACYNSVIEIVKSSISDIPDNFFRLFGQTFDLPISCEIGYGPNLKDLTIV